MRSTNGRYAPTNRLPQDAVKPGMAESLTKSVGGAALQAVVLVTAVKLVDAVFTAVANKARRPKPAKREEPVHA